MTIFSNVTCHCLKTPLAGIFGQCHRRTLSSLPKHIGSGRYQEGDRVLATYKDGQRIKIKLLPPLREDGSNTFGSAPWTINHKEIIGKPAKRIHVDASSSNGNPYSIRVTHPTLEDWVSLAPRTVTPIYASYSAYMTNLLDIHVDPPCAQNDPQTTGQPALQILEAGTGHGSLTIHLARAIAAANPPPPPPDELLDDEKLEERWQIWKQTRRAVVHTVEFNGSRSQDARKAIRTFRGGLYWPHIDFHAGDVGKWIENETQRRATLHPEGAESGFLDIVCLDMPNVQQQIQVAQHAMKNHAQLLVYVPQITQIAACQQEIERLQLPLKLHQVMELGEGISNGRQWDLRFVKTRAEQKELQQQLKASAQSDEKDADQVEMPENEVNAEGVADHSEHEPDARAADEPKFPTMVCRPLVGKMIMGGAFVGLWRKVERP